jgi:hypothetical protein
MSVGSCTEVATAPYGLVMASEDIFRCLLPVGAGLEPAGQSDNRTRLSKTIYDTWGEGMVDLAYSVWLESVFSSIGCLLILVEVC